MAIAEIQVFSDYINLLNCFPFPIQPIPNSQEDGHCQDKKKKIFC